MAFWCTQKGEADLKELSFARHVGTYLKSLYSGNRGRWISMSSRTVRATQKLSQKKPEQVNLPE